MNPLKSYQANRRRKHAREFLRHVTHLRRMREDVLPVLQAEKCQSLEASLRAALGSRNSADIEQSRKTLFEFASRLFKERKHAGLRENLEIIAVAVAVAMAARTYFIQPFKIPTGSMQPTLYGIQYEPVEKSGPMDGVPLRALQWLVTGKWYTEVVAIQSGAIHYQNIQIPMNIGDQEIAFSPASARQIPIEGQMIQSDGNFGGAVSYPRGTKIIFSIS